MSKTSDGKIQCKPILSCIVSLFAEQNELQYAVPGGLIGETVRHMSAMLRRGKGGEEKEGSEYRGEGGERKGQNELQYALPGGPIGKTVCHMSAMLRRREVRERKGKEGSRYGGEGEEYHNRMNFWGD